ncbi:MAG: EamA family transporter RarD, partial [Arenibacterium sp.]
MLAHRVIWSLVFFAVILKLQGRIKEVKSALNGPRRMWRTTIAAAMISVNWFLIIFATAIGRNTESSLGYYIYPLIAVGVGRLLFGEKLGVVQGVSVVLATGGVISLALGLGALPWIALAVAFSFAWYGVLKKTVEYDALVSVTAELLMFLPFVLVILIWVGTFQDLTFGTAMFETIYMIVSGPVTALPLILFSYAAVRVRMSTIGLMQYINPTLQFFTAVVLFAEPFTTWHAVAF